MRRRTFLEGSFALLLANTGCTNNSSSPNQNPPAKTPHLVTLSSVDARTCTWVDAMPNIAGNWEILPGGHPMGDMRVKFQAPYPTKPKIDIDGRYFLREFDNTQSRGEGYYKINAITLAAAQDIFDWDITVTPPSTSRVDVQFFLNIADESLNPAYSGTNATSAPLTLLLGRRSVSYLNTWLNAHPNVRDAIVWEYPQGAARFSSWNTQDRQFLFNTFTSAWNNNFLLLEDPPRNQVTLGDTDAPKTVIASGDAWALYVAHIAYSLAAEIAGWVSWSIAGYSNDQLAILLDSREMFRWDNASNGYVITEGSTEPGVVPASPWTTLLFLYENGLYTCRSRADVIEGLLEWCRQNLIHFSNDYWAKNTEEQWQYRGSPPVVRIMKGTPWPASPVPATAGIMHRTAGCWGTTGFLRAILRVINIPVKHEEHGTSVNHHAMPNFLTEGKYLSHGDDPYDRTWKATPPIPVRELLIDQATYDAWFVNGVSAADELKNVARQPLELAIKYISDDLLRLHCQDVAANNSHANSKVFNALKDIHTLAELEALRLWERIDTKLPSLGGCAAFPP